MTTAVMLLLTMSACSPPPPKFKATDITGSAVASGFDLPDNMGGGFELPDHNGKPRRFNEFYVRNEPRRRGYYTVDHTAASYVFDRQGRVRLYVPHEMSIGDRISDLRRLLNER